MTVDPWSVVVTAGGLATLAVGLWMALRSADERAAREAALQGRIDSARAELAQLRSRHDSGAIPDEVFAAEQKRLTRDFLDGIAALPPELVRGMRWNFSSGRRRAPWIAAVAGLACAIVLFTTFAPTMPWRAGKNLPAASVDAARAPQNPQNPQQPLPALSNEQLERMIAEAGAQVKRAPGDAHAWAMLAHSYDMLGRFAESSKAYQNLIRLAPRDAQALADYADALAVANGRSLAGEPTALIERALAIDPANSKALALAGTAAFERKEYDSAVAFWGRARAASSDAAFRRQLDGSIAEAQAAATGRPIGQRKASSPALAGNPTISGRVSLADEFAAKISPDATVFIFARPARGSAMPVALMRKRVRDLPVDFTLDDSMSMVAGATLSKAGTVVIGARVSQRGDVTPQAGDVQGWSAPVDVGTKDIRLEISEVIK